MTEVVYVDMDGVLVDFESGLERIGKKMRKKYKGREDEVPRIFSLMTPMPGAVESFRAIQNSPDYDAYILSTASWHNSTAWSDKVLWVQKYFGSDDQTVAYKRLILTHHKHLNSGSILIDDRKNNGADRFEGRLIRFGSKKYPDWPAVRSKLGVHLPKS